MASGFREAVEEYTNMTVRVEPYGDDVSRAIPIRAKEAQFTIYSDASGFAVAHGRYVFAVEAWGPQPIRQVYTGAPLFMGAYVREDAPYKTPYDLKGARVPYLSASPAFTLGIQSILAFGNLTWDDVIKVPVSGYSEWGSSVLEGTCDVAYDDTPATLVRELAASRHGCRFLPLDLNDKDGWARLQAVAPWLQKVHTYEGVVPPEGLDTGVYLYGPKTWDWVPDNLVYEVLRAIDLGWDLYKDMHTYCQYYNVSESEFMNTEVFAPIPFHPGAIKYYRELGIWTSEHDEWQEVQLAQERLRMAEFQADKAAWKQKYGW